MTEEAVRELRGLEEIAQRVGCSPTPVGSARRGRTDTASVPIGQMPDQRIVRRADQTYAYTPPGRPQYAEVWEIVPRPKPDRGRPVSHRCHPGAGCRWGDGLSSLRLRDAHHPQREHYAQGVPGVWGGDHGGGRVAL